MRQYTLLWMTIVLLFVLNTVTLCLIIFRQVPPPGPRGNYMFDRRVIETLNLDEAQVEQFNRLKHIHHEAMLAYDDSMYHVYTEYFALLKKPADSTAKAAMEEKISAFYNRKVQLTYAHFAELKGICNPEQQAQFEKLEPFLMQVIAPHPKKD